jgi:hypothetical protein
MVHIVEQGEHLAGIAAKFGFRHFETVWLDPANAALKKLRRNPNLLFPGDQLFIPEKTQKVESAVTNSAHVFQIKQQKILLQIVMQDVNGTAAQNAFYFLKVHEDVLAHNTDADGMTSDAIDAVDRDGELLMPDHKLEFRLKIGHLNPLVESPDDETDAKKRAEAIAAWQDRLNNMGYFAGYTPTNDQQLRWAIEEFQCEHGWNPLKGKKPTGKKDKETRDKLEAVYGC